MRTAFVRAAVRGLYDSQPSAPAEPASARDWRHHHRKNSLSGGCAALRQVRWRSLREAFFINSVNYCAAGDNIAVKSAHIACRSYELHIAAEYDLRRPPALHGDVGEPASATHASATPAPSALMVCACQAASSHCPALISQPADGVSPSHHQHVCIVHCHSLAFYFATWLFCPTAK